MNILLLSVDQWRADCFGFLGHPAVKTPNLDRLAAESVVFRRHFTVAAPCGPARTSLLSGLYPFNHRSITNGTPFDARFPTLPGDLKLAGYDPLLFGYTDTSVDPRTLEPDDPRLLTYEGVMDGFRQIVDVNGDNLGAWLDALEAKGYDRPERDGDIYLHAERPAEAKGFWDGPARYKAEDSDMAFLTDCVLDRLAQETGDPWFYHLVYLRPHPPLIAPAPYNRIIPRDRVEAPLPMGDGEAHPFLKVWAEQHRKGEYFDPAIDFTALSANDVTAMRAVYYGLMAEMDFQVGRLLEALEDTGQLDNTLLVFTCDHGEMAGDHGLWGKGGWYDGAYRIPLMIRDPKRRKTAGRQVQALTESVDVAATVMDWLGKKAPQSWDGVSLLPWLDGDTPPVWRDHVFWEFDFRDIESGTYESALGLTPDQCTLNVWRSDNVKYVHFAGLPPLLFDLANDPGEQHNLAGDSGWLSKRLEMAEGLLAHRMRHAERTLTNHKLTAKGVLTYEGPRRLG